MLLQKLLHASPMSASSIDHNIFLLVLFLAFLFLHHSVEAQPAVLTSHITVVGIVFCDTCSTKTFSRHSYFLPGVDVEIQCKFQANSPKTNEQINFSVTRTTDKMGVYKLEIPHVDGVDCVDGMAIESLCQASLIGSSSSACNIPGLKTSTNEISVKSKQDSLCIYSLKALSYRPSKRNSTLCGKSKTRKTLQKTTFNSSKLTFPALFPSPPSFPFPFTPAPPIFPPPPPPAFNLGDPKTWIPNIPLLSPPPPPAFKLGDPKTWIPNIPLLSPPPPAFNPLDPRTWSPYVPPSQSQEQTP